MDSNQHVQISFVILATGLLAGVFLTSGDAFSDQIVLYSGFVVSLLAWMLVITKLHLIRIDQRFLLLSTLLLAASSLAQPLVLDAQFYRFMWDGLVQTQGLNPYHIVPADESLIALQELSLYELVPDKRSLSVSSPIEQVMFRFLALNMLGWGVHGTSIVFKLALIVQHVSASYLLFRLLGTLKLNQSLSLVYAWNPIIFIFFFSSGIQSYLFIVILLLFLDLWSRNEIGSALLTWGVLCVMLPPLALLLPFLLRGLPWYTILYPILSFMLWWLPFLDTLAISNYLSTQLYLWIYPKLSLSLGYVFTTVLDSPITGALVLLSGAMLGYVIMLVHYLKKLKKSTSITVQQFLPLAMIFSLIFFLFYPTWPMYVAPIFLIFGISLKGNSLRLSILFNTLLLLHVVAMQYNEVIWPTLIFYALLGGLGFLLKSKPWPVVGSVK